MPHGSAPSPVQLAVSQFPLKAKMLRVWLEDGALYSCEPETTSPQSSVANTVFSSAGPSTDPGASTGTGAGSASASPVESEPTSGAPRLAATALLMLSFFFTDRRFLLALVALACLSGAFGLSRTYDHCKVCA